MKPELLSLNDDVVIIGTSIRTSPQAAASDIPTLWGKFMKEGTAQRLPARKKNAPIYAVYCDYENDFRGAYTMVLGVEVDPNAIVPDSMRRVRVPRGKYARFGAKGDPAKVVWQTWMEINEQWSDRTQRRYIADYEVYAGPPSADGSVNVDIVVGLR